MTEIEDDGKEEDHGECAAEDYHADVGTVARTGGTSDGV
jgi:hypothetical protein